MARKQIGSVQKTKDEKLRFKDESGKAIKEFYIKFTEDVTFKAGDYLNMENKQIKLASLKANRDKMSGEVYEKALERIEKMPDFVQFELIRVTKE